MFCHFLYKISSVILQNQNSWGGKWPLVPILLLPLHHFCSCGWSVLELGKGDLENQPVFLVISPGMYLRIVLSRSMNKPKSVFMKPRVVILLFALLPSLSILNFITSWPLQSKLPPGLISLSSLPMFANTQIGLTCMLERCHPHVAPAPCTAGVLLCCPRVWNSILAQNFPGCVGWKALEALSV